MVDNKTTKEENNGKKYEYTYIQFTASEDLKNRIEEYRERISCKTNSAFIRDAIEEKIMRIQQGIPLIQGENNSISRKEIENLIDKRLNSTQSAIQDMIDQNQKEMDKLLTTINKNFQMIQNYSNREEFEERTNKLIALLKIHKNLSTKEIMDHLNLRFNEAMKIISNTDTFKFNNITGRIELNE